MRCVLRRGRGGEPGPGVMSSSRQRVHHWRAVVGQGSPSRSSAVWAVMSVAQIVQTSVSVSTLS